MHDESAALLGGLLLILRERIPWPGWPPTVAETLALVGARKTQAYEMRRRVEDLLPTVLGQPGRPARQPADPGDPTQAASAPVSDAIVRYLIDHPGAICGAGERRTYSDGFRRFVVGLVDPGRPADGLSVADLARFTYVPLGTLKDWLRSPAAVAKEPAIPEPASSEPTPAPPTEQHVPLPAVEGETTSPSPAAETQGEAKSSPPLFLNSHLCLVVAKWKDWEGPFDAFCRMLRTEYRIPYHETFIGNFLQSAGLRQRQPRMPVEAPWSSGTFRTLFPGAQWLGDGTSVVVHWEEGACPKRCTIDLDLSKVS